MTNKLNEYLINTYKSEEKIISDYYKMVKNGKLVDVYGIVNPLTIDNRQQMAPTDNQREYPACAGFSAATIVESMYWKRTGRLKQLDSLQVYQLAKQYDGAVDQDGTYLEYSCKAVMDLCKKDDEFKFLDGAVVGVFYNDRTPNTIEMTKHLIHRFDFLQVGFNIDEGWNDCTNDDYVLKERGMSLGGHAVNLCGYDASGFYVLNQWGSMWGSKGYCVIPYGLFIRQFMYGAYIEIPTCGK